MSLKPLIITALITALTLGVTGCTDAATKAEQEKRVNYDDCRGMVDTRMKPSIIMKPRVAKFCTCITIDLNKALSQEQSEMAKAVFKKAAETENFSSAILSEIPLSDADQKSFKDTIQQTFAVCERKLQK